LFVAAFIPGIIATIGYAIAIMIYVRLRPDAGPAATRESWSVRFRSLNAIWPVAVIFLIVIGGIYKGAFTPTEGATVGTVATAVMAACIGGLGLRAIRSSLLEMAKITGMIFLILIAAEVYSAFLALSQIPQDLAEWIGGRGLGPYTVLLTIILIYILLGAVMDEIGMILLTVPVFFPLVMGLDFGMSPTAQGIWFGILLLNVVEIGLILPPIGLNVFVINAMAKDVPLMQTYKGITPFFISDLVRIGIIVAFPATCTWLPGL
jgi:C4-dicarboxylate transporter, DctM subunit